MIRLLLATLLLITAAFVGAHNVVGGVYVIGDTIEGEAGFSNGDMAPAGIKVIITDMQGVDLGQTETDAEGVFRFKPSRYVTHHFSLDLGAGHTLSLTLAAEELPAALAPTQLQAPAATAIATAADTSATTLNSQIEAAVARQVKPLRRELRELKEAAGLRDIVGGIGYILGLCGLAALLRERKMRKETA